MIDHRPRRPQRVLPAMVTAGALVFAVVVVFGTSPTGLLDEADTTIPELAAPPESTPPATNDPPRASSPEGGYPEKPAGWQQLDAGPLVSRMDAAVVWTGDWLLIWGGRDLRNGFTSGAIWSPSATDEPAWRTLPRPEIAGGSVRVAVWTGRTLLVHSDEMAVLEPGELVWTATAPPPIAMDPFAAVWTGSEVIVVGRSSEGSPATTVAIAYGADGSCCRVLPPPPIDIDHGVAVWNGTEVVLVGGRTAEGGSALLATFDPAGDTWVERGPTPLGGGPGLTAVWAGGSLVAVDADLGGGRWNEATGWRTMKAAPFDALGCFTRLTVAGSDVFAWSCRRAAVYQPASGRWTIVATPELPAHTISTSCVPQGAGRTVFLWCGNGDGAPPLFYAVDLDIADGTRNT